MSQIILQGISIEEFRGIIREEAQKLIRAKQPALEVVDPLLNLEKLLDFLEEKTGKRYARQTVYDLVTKRKIPFTKRRRFLYFQQSEITSWLSNGMSK